MSSQEERITKAKLIDGKVLIEQADGTYLEAEDRTDFARQRSFTEEEIERMAKEDGEDACFPEDQEPTRVLRPGASSR